MSATAIKATAPLTVLVVDDDRDSREMYRHYLSHVGCVVRTARNGRRAIEKVAQRPPDVIVMDLAMPELDGWAASRQLKSAPETAHIPIIALSAVQMARAGARAAGCDGFLAKPCLPDMLWWEIRAVTGSSMQST
jgi:CheY-like chemotaxis protein